MTLGANDYRCLPLGYPCGQCTSFVAWRIINDLGHADFTAQWRGGTFADAGTWTAAARAAGIPVSSTPHRGDVAIFPPNTGGAGTYGHVAVVLAVDAGVVTVEDYNWGDNGTYHQHTVSPAGLFFATFLPAGAVPSGDDFLTRSQKEALVRLAYLAALGRDPESVDMLNGYADEIRDDGANVDGVLQQITDSAEAQKWRAAVRKVAGL